MFSVLVERHRSARGPLLGLVRHQRAFVGVHVGSLEVITGVAPEFGDMLMAQMCMEDRHTPFVFVVQEGTSLAHLAKTLKFFDRERDVFILPKWDSIPHKGVSPSSLVMATRMKCLLDISNAKAPYVMLTTSGAVAQKVLPAHSVASATITVAPGDGLSMDALVQHLVACGYTQSSAVREVGSFAVRGEIVDIFQPIDNKPTRIDFCYDAVESIRCFDLDTQITDGGALPSLVIYPASEVIKTEENLNRFYTRYMQQYPNPDPAFAEAMLSRQKCMGEEQWLPLLQADELSTIFDYVPNAKLVLAEQASEEVLRRLEGAQEEDYTAQSATGKSALFLDLQGYIQITRSFHKAIFCRFDATSENNLWEHQQVICSSSNIGAVPNFRLLAQEQKADVFAVAADYINSAHKTLILACYSEGSLLYFIDKFKEHGIHISRVHEYAGPIGAFNAAVLPTSCDVVTHDFIVITEYSLLKRQCAAGRSSGTVVSEDTCLAVGDVVVHKDYGVGIFNALRTLSVCGHLHDFVEILYRNNDKFFVPVEDIDLITKYGTNTDVVLDKLGSTSWQERSAKLKKRIKDIAQTLLHSEAMRVLAEGNKFLANQRYLDFCKEFPYVETEDQLKAISEVEEDLASGKVMDRLICGDVGFGKTEVALRAAFLVINEDPAKQVAVIVPTTLLCRQHLAAFRERFQNYDINVQQLARSSATQKSKVKKALENGDINIIIGTSALLAEDIRFLDLSLLIIDEEQHFGVQQKEQLKKLRNDVHVLSLSATPIPRTLHMSLSGIKNLSVLRTPPMGRMAVDIAIIQYDGNIIKTAILDEVSRGGRVFFTCPFISDIDGVLADLQKLVPNVKVEVAHGRTSTRALDKIMNDFFDGKFSVLLTTSIIESGIDIPFANTIIVHNADMFGLAQLYQLKGRVGRSTLKGYAYFIVSKKALPDSPGMKRLEAVRSLNSVGSGFALALQDMDMRGFGNLVGEEQSGNIKEVGIELYHKMLEEAIAVCQEQPHIQAGCHSVKVGVDANVRIPESYIRELDLRIRVYKKISSLKTAEEADTCFVELVNRFGAPPPEVMNLLNVMRIKQLCSALGIQEVTQAKRHVTFSLSQGTAAHSGMLKHIIDNHDLFTICDHSIRMSVPKASQNQILEYILSHLVCMAAA
ncbi:UNVERIFIED_ORG: transcription-repair coupling factor [Anaplasma ovis]|uniref:transcription-repair coupling factor n=1 Tax=Anaplasma marginale TaxID=770 RepID=UPI000C791D70